MTRDATVIGSQRVLRRRELLRLGAVALAGTALTACTASHSGSPSSPAAGGAAQPASAPATGQPVAKLNEPLRLGIHIPITGPLAALGSLAKHGAVMAIDEINAQGGVGGYPIEVLDEDAGATNDAVISAYKRIASRRPHAVIGSVGSTQVLAASPDIRETRVPYIFFSTATPVTRQGLPYLFRLNYVDEFRIDATVRYLVQNLQRDRVASFHTNDEYGNSAHQTVVAVLAKLGSAPVSEQSSGVNDKDLAAQISSVIRSGANGVVENCFPTITALLMKQTKQLGGTYTIMGGAGPASPSVLNILTDDEADGVYSASTGVPQAIDRERVRSWITAYQAKWKEDPDAYSANGYDSVYIVKRAVEQAGSLETEAIHEAIAATKGYPGINYPITFDQYGDGVHAVVLTRNTGKRPEVIDYIWEEGFEP